MCQSLVSCALNLVTLIAYLRVGHRMSLIFIRVWSSRQFTQHLPCGYTLIPTFFFFYWYHLEFIRWDMANIKELPTTLMIITWDNSCILLKSLLAPTNQNTCCCWCWAFSFVRSLHRANRLPITDLSEAWIVMSQKCLSSHPPAASPKRTLLLQYFWEKQRVDGRVTVTSCRNRSICPLLTVLPPLFTLTNSLSQTLPMALAQH